MRTDQSSIGADAQKTWNKLVRDRIPEIIQAEGRKAETKVLNEQEYARVLRLKLMEEAEEVAGASDSNEMAVELADALEVSRGLFGYPGQIPRAARGRTETGARSLPCYPQI